jgi:hypothetical protein
MKIHSRWLTVALSAVLTATISFSLMAQSVGNKATTSPQQLFASPDEAVNGLVEAIRAGDAKSLLKVIGPDARAWLFTGDAVADKADMHRFLARYEEKNSLVMEGNDKAILNTGSDDWPFPAPIVKQGEFWKFDAEAGREEVINRRVGHNELNTIQTLHAIVDAQREYAATDNDRNGFNDYAPRFRSQSGKKDGLYWPTKAGEPESPLGPLLAVSASEGYNLQAGNAKQQPYHGYLFKILTKQGKEAPGGAFDYMVKGKLIGGFAVVAYPLTYGVSGVKAFIVNHDNVIYEKDLGPDSSKIGAAMTTYNPDSTWSKVIE